MGQRWSPGQTIPFTVQHSLCLVIEGDLNWQHSSCTGNAIGLSSPTPSWFLKIRPYIYNPAPKVTGTGILSISFQLGRMPFFQLFSWRPFISCESSEMLVHESSRTQLRNSYIFYGLRFRYVFRVVISVHVSACLGCLCVWNDLCVGVNV